MHRFYPDPALSRDDLVFLSGEEARHALTVLRMKPGNFAEVVCDALPWLAELVSTEEKTVCLRKLKQLPSEEPHLAITLFQGLPKSDKMDFIVQKATELGVIQIVPVLMQRCVSRPDSRDAEKKLFRWEKIAREASKQSHRCIVPYISSPCALQALNGLVLPQACIVPWEDSYESGLLDFHRSHPDLSSIGILIGPEGGITEEEIFFLKSLGFIPVTLGKRILRTETAGLAAVSSLMCLYGEMERS